VEHLGRDRMAAVAGMVSVVIFVIGQYVAPALVWPEEQVGGVVTSFSVDYEDRLLAQAILFGAAGALFLIVLGGCGRCWHGPRSSGCCPPLVWANPSQQHLPCERKHGRRVTSSNASRPPPTLAFTVVVCRLLPARHSEFAACSPPAARRAWWCRVVDACGAVSSVTGRRARGGQPAKGLSSPWWTGLIRSAPRRCLAGGCRAPAPPRCHRPETAR
jgi:hypothetical protein